MWKFERRLWYSKFWKENMLLSHWGVMSCHIWFGSHWGEMSCHNLLVILGSQMKAFWTRGLEWEVKEVLVGFKFVLFFWWCARDFQNPSLLTYLPIYILIYLLIYLSIYMYIYYFILFFIILSTYLFTYLLIYLPIYLPLPWDGWKVPILKKRATKESTIPHKGGDI